MTPRDIMPATLRSISRKSPETELRYRPIIEKFAAQFDGIELAEISVHALEEFCLEGDVMPSTACVRASAVANLYRQAKRAGAAIPDNPCAMLELPRPEPKAVEPFTTQEMRRIAYSCRTARESAMVGILFSAAPRIRDLVSLRWDAISNNGRIRIVASKNKRELWLPLSIDTLRYLRSLRESQPDSEYPFWTGRGQIRTAVRHAQAALAGIFERAGVADAYAHRARHTLATRMLGIPGVTMQDVADVLGDSLAVTERRYAKWSQARQDRIEGFLKEAWV